MGQSFPKFCTEHGSITAVVCAKLSNDWATAQYIMGKQVSRDLSLRYISDGNPMLHKAPVKINDLSSWMVELSKAGQLTFGVFWVSNNL